MERFQTCRECWVGVCGSAEASFLLWSKKFEVGSECCLGKWGFWIKGKQGAGSREDAAVPKLLLEGAE